MVLLPLLFLLMIDFGCATTSSEKVRETRQHERVVKSTLTLAESKWQQEPEVFLIRVEQSDTKTYDLQEDYHQTENYSGGGLLLYGGACFISFGLPIPLDILTGGKFLWKPLVGGSSNVSVYKRRTQKGLQSTEAKPADGIPVRVQCLGGGTSFSGRTDNNGVAEFRIAQDIRDALTLKPCALSVLALQENRWITLGSIDLDGQRIEMIAQRVRADNMAFKGTPVLPPFGQISVITTEGEIAAGSTCDISIAVKNVGKGEFYQLMATGESAAGAFDGLKFEFGKVNTNESLTLTRNVEIPKGQPTGPVVVTFKWTELNGYQPDPVQARIMVRGLARPRFATSVQVIDDNSGNSVGNGDGRIQKGEAVDLLVSVKNIGDGSAKDVKVSMDGISEEGVIVNVPEAVIGEIPAGETKQTRLTVTTKKTAKVDKLTPTIHIVDRYLNQQHDESLVLALDSELPPSIMVYKSTVYVGKEEIAVQSGAGNDTSVIARAKPGTSLDATGELGEWLRVELPKIGVGWVHRSGVQFEPPSPTEVAATAPSVGVIEILQKAPPLIAVSKPLNDAKVAVSHVEVSGVIVDNQAVSRAEFKLNGELVQIEGQRGIGVEAKTTGLGREYPFAFTANLAVGQNQIEITAWNADGLKTEKTLSVVYEKDKGNIYVVCIGIDKYQDQSIPHLKYAVADARSVAECFEQHLGVPAANTYLFTDEEATLQNIKDVLGVKVRQRAGKNDTVIIYFSGHGAPEADPHSPDQDGVAKYLLPVNAERDSLFSTALAMEEVRTIFRRLISDRVIFIADSCYSGAAGGRTLMPTGTDFRSINQDNLLARLRDTGIGRVIMTASRGSEVSQEKDELGHGVFTYYLLRGLQGEADKNHTGIVTVSELYEYVTAQVPQATQNTQTPLMSADEVAGEIVMGVVK
jgi:hypothetical protein